MNSHPDKWAYHEEYAHYAEQFDPMNYDRQARRQRKPRHDPNQGPSREEIVEELADTAGLESGFNTTYQPGRYEEGWLLQSLRPFFDQQLIEDVMAVVKGGKEASVYRCAGTQASGEQWLAAKVYRPRFFRNLRNDKVYRQGRAVLDVDGKEVEPHEARTMRALEKKSNFGQQVAHTSWLMHEYTTLKTLHAAGADVPRPLAASDNAILMSYVGGKQMAAPTLNGVSLELDEAAPLFKKVLQNVALMLEQDLIHGDLSAYNILYWQGDVTLIDFPQVVDSKGNPDAYEILERDITRVCEYFAGQGVRCDAQQVFQTLWRRYLEPDPELVAADLSRMEIGD